MLIVCIIISNCLQDCSTVYVRDEKVSKWDIGEMRDCHAKINMVETYVRVAPSHAKFSFLLS